MRPIIYQVFTRLYYSPSKPTVQGGTLSENGCGKFKDFTLKRLQTIRESGFTHVWYTGVLDHATQTEFPSIGLRADNQVKGQAGSPYAVRDYYNVAPELSTVLPRRLHEFELLVRRTHRVGMGVIMDFVPNHVACHYTGTFHPFTDQNYYSGHICDGDWTDTAKLNYDNQDTWQKMLDILLFWAARGVDGFRCDMAELVPVAFWQWAIPQVKALYSGILFIAEVYQPWRYAEYVHLGGFDYLYDKVGLYDTLVAILKGQASATAITGCWQRLGDLGSHMLHFMENHDEQRLASDFICGDGRKALPAMIVSAFIDTCPLMVYFGQELGEHGMEAEGFSGRDGKTTIFDYASVPTISAQLNGTLHPDSQALAAFYSHLLRLAGSEHAVTDGRFFDLMYVNPQSNHFNPHQQYAFLRADDDTLLIVCVHFGDEPCDIRLQIPAHAFEYLHLPVLKVSEAKELLANQTFSVPLSADIPIPLHLPAHGGVVISLKLHS